MISRLVPALTMSACLAATPQVLAMPLSGEHIAALIEDRTVHLSTPYGIELPLRYRSGGEVSGDISGITLARMFAPREVGTWWVEDNRLCQQWPTWYDGEVFCFTIERIGADRITWERDDGFSGTARISG
jgi:hypothetical protein